MTALGRALWAETLKMKRTPALWLAVITPLSVVALQFAVAYQRAEYYVRQMEDPWVRFGDEMAFFWALLMLPLFVTLETALLGGFEHGNRQWKHLYALPLPRWVGYAAKQCAGMALIGLSVGLLILFTIAAGMALQALKPELRFVTGVPLGRLIQLGGSVYLASWLIISIHTWIGLRWKNFVVAMVAGVVAVTFTLAMGGSDYARLYPWMVPATASEVYATGQVQWVELILSSLGGIVVAVLGCRDVPRRDVL